MTDVAKNLANVKSRIAQAEKNYDREPGSVTLIAVSKTKPVSLIQQAIAAGQKVFGENYVQEAVSKKQALQEFELEWHFIGPIQSNKTRLLAENFDWIHSVDRLKIAQRLSEQRPDNMPPISMMLQVNISQETSKSGVEPEALESLVESVLQLPKVSLQGFMAIPAKTTSFEEQRIAFRQLAELRDNIQNDLKISLPCLSMGMSGDMEAAIAEGATHIRIGTDIFGAREYA